MIPKNHHCPICDSKTFLYDSVDFNKSCEENQGIYLPPSGIDISYFLCENCQFCYAPEFSGWSLEDFEENIYNDSYINIDPEYPEARPQRNFLELQEWFGDEKENIRHLDYGGGNGRLSELLREAGWNSMSYDPFVQRNTQIESLGKFDFITAFEVFEHVPDARQLISNLSSLLVNDGIIFFTTWLTDGNILSPEKLKWWYAAPRNGHISLFSQKSLILLAQKEHFMCCSLSASYHVLLRNVPAWASKKFKMA